MEETKNTAPETAAEEIKQPEGKPEKGEKKKLKALEAELEKLQKELEAKQTELDEANDKYMRMIAEYDNFRRRSAKEKETIYADAYADALSELFPVIDNLERAASYKDAENVSKGVEMTLKAFCETLEKLGVAAIDMPEDKLFDPNLHNAVMHVEDDAYGEGEIVEVLQKGYMRGEKVLRYAMVKVAN